MKVRTASGGDAAVSTNFLYLTMNCLSIAIGNIGGPLIVRLYFLHAGKRVWFSGFLQTGGWPIMLIPLLVSYTRRRRTTTAAKNLVFMNRRVFSAAAAVGVILGVNNYLYAYGLAKLPVSTYTILAATQLVFTAVLAFVVVKQRFTAYLINAVVLLTAGAVVLGLRASGERPERESVWEYWSGFAATVVTAALSALCLLLVQLTYKKAKQEVTYNLVMQMQLVMCVFATAFPTVGMLINDDFQAISREAREFKFGATKYYMVVVCTAIIRQCTFLGTIGVVFYSSSLYSSITITLCLPITQLLGVVFYNENFQVEEGISLFLSLWGFISYFYGEFKQMKMKQDNDKDCDDTP